ncbi:DoxX family protein [Deinococcus irradiatisoli]|uniref:DoxX family protein n=1 Tax=Deinococcus irradiatisoli TaxID=2202254 RepID=A0A2Z3JBE9_9DEIO|nr:DoxX family protein [Deinococcus irradiatisoli]AWN22362.1 DoxX family protein [Deinococcus irradiatisoli]
MSILNFIGRAALASMFIQGGLSALQDPKQRARMVERAGLPAPELLTQINGGVMAASGVMMTLGIMPRTSALALLASMVPTTVIGHPFWRLEGAERQGQMLHFSKNVAMMGGLLLVVADR